MKTKLLRGIGAIPLGAALLAAGHPGLAADAPDPGNWPSFRGRHASGVADGQNLMVILSPSCRILV